METGTRNFILYLGFLSGILLFLSSLTNAQLCTRSARVEAGKNMQKVPMIRRIPAQCSNWDRSWVWLTKIDCGTKYVPDKAKVPDLNYTTYDQPMLLHICAGFDNPPSKAFPSPCYDCEKTEFVNFPSREPTYRTEYVCCPNDAECKHAAARSNGLNESDERFLAITFGSATAVLIIISLIFIISFCHKRRNSFIFWKRSQDAYEATNGVEPTGCNSAGQNDYVSDDLKLVESEYEEICDVDQDWKKEKLPIFDKDCDPIENGEKFPAENSTPNTNGVFPAQNGISPTVDQTEKKDVVCLSDPAIQSMDGNLMIADKLLSQSTNGADGQEMDLLHLTEFNNSQRCPPVLDSAEILSSQTLKDTSVSGCQSVNTEDQNVSSQNLLPLNSTCVESPESGDMGQGQNAVEGQDRYINITGVSNDLVITENCANLTKSESTHSYEHLDPTTREDPSSSQTYEALIPVHSPDNRKESTDQSRSS